MAAYRVEVPGWHPATVNELTRSVRARIRLKKRDRKWVGDYLGLFARVPPATGPRRVGLTLVYPPGARRKDVDAHWKSLLDALVWHGYLLSDSPLWCELTPVAFGRGPLATIVSLEDLGPTGPPRRPNGPAPNRARGPRTKNHED